MRSADVAPLSLVLRADANCMIGAGHAMRLLTLGAMWLERHEGPVEFWGRDNIPFVKARARELGIEVMRKQPPLTGAVLVVDTYDRDVRELCASIERPCLRVIVDDLGGSVPNGYSIIWNPNPYGSADMYVGFSGPVIAGDTAVPIRPLGDWRPGHGRGLGVLLGGGDPPPELVAALEGVAQRFQVPVAGAGKWAPAWWEPVDSISPWNRLVDVDVLLTAAGSSVWEAASVGVPVVVIRTAENQSKVTDWVASKGGAVVDGLGRSRSRLEPDLVAAIRTARPLPHLSSGQDTVIAGIRSMVA